MECFRDRGSPRYRPRPFRRRFLPLQCGAEFVCAAQCPDARRHHRGPRGADRTLLFSFRLRVFVLWRSYYISVVRRVSILVQDRFASGYRRTRRVSRCVRRVCWAARPFPTRDDWFGAPILVQRKIVFVAHRSGCLRCYRLVVCSGPTLLFDVCGGAPMWRCHGAVSEVAAPARTLVRVGQSKPAQPRVVV